METLLCSIYSSGKQWIVVVVLVFVGVSEADSRYKCGPGINTPGVTWPAGDISLEYGSPLEIYCMLNPSVVAQGFNASNLTFYHTLTRIDNEYITYINESTAKLYVEKPEPIKEYYYCKLINGTEECPVCLNIVSVGFRPQNVLNFSCVSHNWNNLNCTWVPPPNPIKTKYTIAFYLPGRPGSRQKLSCPNETDVKGLNYCFWDQATNPPYRQPYEYYYFVITGENAFGNITTKEQWHHFRYVIPTKAANLTMLEKTTSSIMIQWSVVFPMQNFPPGVEQKVEYRSLWDDPDHWQVANTSTLNNKNATHRFNITGLKYANCVYDLRVFMRSAAAFVNDVWSQPATLTVRTKPTIPGAVPKTDVGSFEIQPNGMVESRDIYVYWQQIPVYLHNGNEFKYHVEVEENGVPKPLTPNETKPAYAKFIGMSLNSYRFKIRSENDQGRTVEYSEVRVPAQEGGKSLIEPQSFTKIAFDEHVYELSWKPPASNVPVTSYTIFWCDNKKDRPYQCTGTLNWTKVPNDVTILNITVPDEKIYQFAISANTKHESGGMVWASCTVIHNKMLGKMKSVWINKIGSTFIEVVWKLECSDRIGVVTGFLVTYCPTVMKSENNLECKEPLKTITIKVDGATKSGNITGLKPYTTYMIMVAVETKHSVGQWSDRQLNTTLEAAPSSPPQNVNVTEVTNTSMLVTWSPPSSMNGVLQHYKIYYNDLTKEVKPEEGKKNDPYPQYRLEGLWSFTLYNVSVAACTVACSDPSPTISIMTKIGSPGQIEQPRIKWQNASHLKMTWKEPQRAGGMLDMYQVKVETDNNNTDIKNYTSGTKAIIPVNCDDGGPRHYYSFFVRAVNFDKNEYYYGPWSEPESGDQCINTGNKLLLILYIVFVVAFVVILAILGRWMWRIYRQYKDVPSLKIPIGLISDGISLSDHHPHQPSLGSVTSKDTIGYNSPDQEQLLDKKNLEGETGDGSSLGEGDSSGCSSGHESVVSSLTAGTHISCSDSGTEADQLNEQRPASLQQLYSNSGSPAMSIRYRNKTSSSASDSSCSRRDRGMSTPNLTGVPDYSQLSWNPTLVAGYVTAPPPPVSQYMPHPPLTLKGTVTGPKVLQGGYVMAGESDTADQYCRLGHSDYVPHS